MGRNRTSCQLKRQTDTVTRIDGENREGETRYTSKEMVHTWLATWAQICLLAASN